MTGPDDTDTPNSGTTRSGDVDDQSTGAYALGALEPDAAADFERRMARSEELRTEVAGFTDTAALLGAAVPPVTPPPHLKANLMAALATTPQLPASAEPASSEVPTEPARETATVTPIGAARGGQRRAGRRTPARLSLFVAAAAAAAAVFVGGAFVGTNIGGSDPAPASAFQDLATLSTASDMSRTVIELPEGGTAALMVSEEKGLSAVVLDGAAPLPDGEVYQAWLIRDGRPHNAGVMKVAGSAVQMLEGEFHNGDTVALTVEPSGGSETPTGPPILFGA